VTSSLRAAALALLAVLPACERSEAPTASADPAAAPPPSPAPPSPSPPPPPDAATAADAAPARKDPMPGASTTFRDRVEAALGAGYAVSPQTWHGPATIELYRAHETKGKPDSGIGVAVTASALERGKAGMPLVLAATQDPVAIAEAAALLVVGGPAPVVDAAAVPDAARAQFHPPRLDGKRVVYWGKGHRGRAQVEQITVDLTSFAVATAAAGALRDAGKDPIDLAVAKIASRNQVQEMQGVDELIRLSSKNPAARAALERSLAVATSADARTAAIYTLAKAPGAGTVAALIAVVSGDADPKVRRLAAMNLGRLRSQEARPALEAAASSDSDAAVRSIAAASLKQLDGK
jgi:hypothetical protein